MMFGPGGAAVDFGSFRESLGSLILGRQKMKRITGAMAYAAMVLILCGGASSAQAQGKSALRVDVPGAVHRSLKIGHTNPDRVLHVSVSLPYGDPEGMQRFV